MMILTFPVNFRNSRDSRTGGRWGGGAPPRPPCIRILMPSGVSPGSPEPEPPPPAWDSCPAPRVSAPPPIPYPDSPEFLKVAISGEMDGHADPDSALFVCQNPETVLQTDRSAPKG